MKLVLTGGPSGGKTTLAQTIQREFLSTVAVVPEAASIVFAGGWPRRKTAEGVRHQQKAIYFVQREVEEMLHFERGDRLLICDRGSLDGVAYWPSVRPTDDSSGVPTAEFLEAVGTSLEREIARYDYVIHLDTAPATYYDDTNPIRNESYEEAWRLNERVKAAWAAHPQRFVIGNDVSGHFIHKLNRALNVIQFIIDGRGYAEIAAGLATI